MRATVTLTVEAEATVAEIQAHFEEMLTASHELIDERGTPQYFTISEVQVEEVK